MTDLEEVETERFYAVWIRLISLGSNIRTTPKCSIIQNQCKAEESKLHTWKLLTLLAASWSGWRTTIGNYYLNNDIKTTSQSLKSQYITYPNDLEEPLVLLIISNQVWLSQNETSMKKTWVSLPLQKSIFCQLLDFIRYATRKLETHHEELHHHAVKPAKEPCKRFHC